MFHRGWRRRVSVEVEDEGYKKEENQSFTLGGSSMIEPSA